MELIVELSYHLITERETTMRTTFFFARREMTYPRQVGVAQGVCTKTRPQRRNRSCFAVRRSHENSQKHIPIGNFENTRLSQILMLFLGYIFYAAGMLPPRPHMSITSRVPISVSVVRCMKKQQTLPSLPSNALWPMHCISTKLLC